jgi:hypothetical protein
MNFIRADTAADKSAWNKITFRFLSIAPLLYESLTILGIRLNNYVSFNRDLIRYYSAVILNKQLTFHGKKKVVKRLPGFHS